MFFKNQTLFQRIFISVFIPEILIFIGALYINYTDTKSVLEEQIENHSESVKLELNQVVVLQGWMLDLLETKIDDRTKHFSRILVDSVFSKTVNISSINLDDVRSEIGMDSEMEEIYIIDSNGTVINTTFKLDYGLNLYSLDNGYQVLFNRLKETGKYHLEGFSEENKTKKIRKFSYMASKDKKYIIELGIYSMEAEKLLSTISDKLDKIREINPTVQKVNIFLNSKEPLNLYSEDSLSNEDKLLFQAAISTKSDTSVVYNNIQKELMYFSAEGKEGAIILDYNLALNDEILQGIVNEALIILVISLLILLVVLFFNVKGITFPIKQLMDGIQEFGEGKFDARVKTEGTKEISYLSRQFNQMAQQVQDAHSELHESHQQIQASINYAKRIQTALLTSDDYWNEISPEHFVYLKPKDVVSGDFFWAYKTEDDVAIWVAADCTGHGVPGAFMSMLGISFLDEIVVEGKERDAGNVLNKLRERIIRALEQKTNNVNVGDGMDIALCIWDKKTNILEYAGAYNSLYIVNPNRVNYPEGALFFGDNKQAFEIKADKQPIGKFIIKNMPFTTKKIQLEKGDVIYTFSDGFMDQFGGENDKKYMSKGFKKLLLSINDQDMASQKETINTTLNRWIGTKKQNDDICIVGIKVV